MKEPTLSEYFSTLRKLGMLLYHQGRAVKSKPLYGASFMDREYSIGSLVHYDSGLYEVSYYVFDQASHFPLSCDCQKGEAIAMARRLLDKHPEKIRAERAALEVEILAYEKSVDEEHARVMAGREAARPKVPSIPKRRQRIFDESGGKCHYCETVLTLDGKWHIEHKMPRALGGDNQPGNLVASCVPCNMKKRDTTDVEFKAKRAGVL
jgi:5-methylcytosine-specific restriction endonuclease McrA